MLRVLPLLVVLVTLGSGSVLAQRARGAPRVIQLDEIRIEGRVQKPNAFYILNRSSIGYEILELRESFTREILRSVQSEPF